MSTDYKLIDVPSMLSRDVRKRDPTNPSRWVKDETWYENIRQIYTTLVRFFLDHELLKNAVNTSSIDSVVIMFSDLNDAGKLLVKSGADERWLNSFDRVGSKKEFSDVRYLEKALRNLVERPN